MDMVDTSILRRAIQLAEEHQLGLMTALRQASTEWERHPPLPGPLPTPDHFAEGLGYDGESRFVTFHQIPGCEAVWFDDGCCGGTGDWEPFRMLIRSPKIRPYLRGYHLGGVETAHTHRLLLDRDGPALQVVTSADAEHRLCSQWVEVERGGRLMLTEEQWAEVKVRLEKRIALMRPTMDELVAECQRRAAYRQYLADWLEALPPAAEQVMVL